MTSKQEIKDAFTIDLKDTPQYAIVLAIKQVILDEIAKPNVQSQVIYEFTPSLSEEQIGVFKMCMIVEFGFDTNNISGNAVIIDMKSFLI
jgi:hypothetical protein